MTPIKRTYDGILPKRKPAPETPSPARPRCDCCPLESRLLRTRTRGGWTLSLCTACAEVMDGINGLEAMTREQAIREIQSRDARGW